MLLAFEVLLVVLAPVVAIGAIAYLINRSAAAAVGPKGADEDA